MIGAGVQGRSHLPVIAHVLPGAELSIFDRDPERARGARGERGGEMGIGRSRSRLAAREAVAGADVVVTVASFGPVQRQVMPPDWLGTDALVVPVDYATYCAAEVARDAALFLVDQRGQFLANREGGAVRRLPGPAAMIGEALAAGSARPDGRVVVTHLGVGIADLVFGTRSWSGRGARARHRPPG